MNCFGLPILLVLGVSLHLVTAKCGAQDIRKNIGFREYYRFGETSQERCRYTFNPPPDEDSLFILDIKHYRAFRQGTRQNAYLTMPDGSRVHHLNKHNRVGICYRYSKQNFQTNPCLEELADKYCSNPTTELKQWPPTLSSVSLTSEDESHGEFSYDMDYTFFYMYVTCPKSKLPASIRSDLNETKIQEVDSGNFFVSTIAVSCLLIVALMVAMIALTLLFRKSRREKEASKTDLEQSSPPNNNHENEQDNGEDIYENPNQIISNYSPDVTARNSAYSHIDLNAIMQQRPRSGNYNNVTPIPPKARTLPQKQEIVHNMLYHNV